MKGGFSGKILKINLTSKSIGTIDTEKYEEFGGGHGIGSAIFFDMVGDQLPFEAFDPRNPIIMITSPFSGTMMPGSGRCEVQGLGPMLHPVEWFGHSSFGGRFTAQLKFAGWDGIVVDGAADDPVWINIIDDKVTIESAEGVWGMDTWDTQQEIFRRVIPDLKFGEWATLADGGETTQLPAVVCCGTVGESKSRMGALLHGPGSQAALCGFGGVFGSKKLKAISAIGSGSVPIADPKALMEARLWFRQFLWDVDSPRDVKRFETRAWSHTSGRPSGGNTLNRTIGQIVPAHVVSCASCPRACRMRLATADSNESVCAGTMSINIRNSPDKVSRQANDLMQKYGFGHWQFMGVMSYVSSLNSRGLLGKGKKIECDLPLDQIGSMGYYDTLMRKISLREGIGDDLTEGCARFAEKYGLYDEDASNGNLRLPYWGTREHYDPRIQVEWGFGSLLGERDLMLHSFANHNFYWMANSGDPFLTADDSTRLYMEALVPYNDDRYLADFGDGPTGIYSDSKVKLVAWVKHYEKFWIGCGGFCGFRWPMTFTNNSADYRGATPHAEPKFWNAVTGDNRSFADYMELGHKIYTLDRSIWVLQGRHRKMEVFPDYLYDLPSNGHMMPMVIDGKWTYDRGIGRKLDREKVEDFKTRFYKFEGYNPDNGYPTRNTLEKIGLNKVADLLQKKGRLG